MSATTEKLLALPELNDGKVSQDRLLTWWIIVLVLIKLWLVEAQDFLATFTPHDDYLFVRLAKSILGGEWLGPYDHLTLVKGPVYPIFLAFAHHTGLPLLFVQQLLYCLICVLALVALKPLVSKRWPLMIVFFLLLFNPFTYLYPATARAFRFGLSMPLVLALFACMCGLLLRVNKSHAKLFLWASMLGLVFGLLWFTREEGIWLLPSMGLFGLYFLVVGGEIRFSTILTRSLYLIVIAAIFVGFQSGFRYLNNKFYGAPHIIELKSPQFQAAYGGLMNINGDKSTRYIPVSKQSQEEAYRVSPTFRQLKPYFEEAAKGVRWPRSFYIWSLRSRVVTSGNAESLPKALEFYGKVGEEIRIACEQGKIRCLDRKPSIRPIWKTEYFDLVPSTFWAILKQAFTFSFFTADEHVYNKWLSNATKEMVKDYQFVTRENLAPGNRAKLRAYPRYYMHMITERFRILTDIAEGYKAVIGFLFWGAVVVHLLLGIQCLLRKTLSFEFISGCITIGGILSLVSVLTYVKITLWPINRPLFSIYPLILFYVSIMLLFTVKYFTERKNLSNISP